MTAPTATTTTTTGTGTGTGTDGQQGQQGQQPAPTVDPSKVIPPTKPAEQATGELSAQEKIAKLEADLAAARAEAGKTRVNAKAAAAEAAAAQAAEDTKREIGKLLGFVTDGDDADPAKLQQQIEQHQSAVREKDQELAVYRAAAAHNADPNKLLDSRSFLASIKDIDPVDTDKIAAAIKTAVEANEFLKTQPAGQAPRASGTATTGGSGEGAVTPEQFKAMGYDERVKLFQSNRALYDQLSGRA